MCKISKSSGIQSVLVVVLTMVPASSIEAGDQTVGDTFIDTSEWVQSTSPIRDNGTVQGYITETINRGYRGENYDRYYQSRPTNTAIEFTQKPLIQPIVYENSTPTDSTSLAPPVRPTPDPVVQSWNRQGTRYNTPSTNSPSGGYVSQAGYRQPVTPSVSTNGIYPEPGQLRGLSSSGSIQPVSPPVWNPGSVNAYPASATVVDPANGSAAHIPGGTYIAPAGYTTSTTVYNPGGSYLPTQYSTGAVPYASSQQPPTQYTSTLTNCCDPVYAQTQFVTPNVNTGPGALRTYPQYNAPPYNPYPNRGFGISQPYMRHTWVPLIPLRSMPYGTYLGQGIIGQPVAYVEGEPVRNFLRYVFP